MELGKVVGTVVSTVKDVKIEGRKLLIVNLISGDGKPSSNHVVAIDTVGAGIGEVVICVRGSSARMVKGMETVPTDTSIVGIVDTLEYKGKVIYQKFEKDIKT